MPVTILTDNDMVSEMQWASNSSPYIINSTVSLPYMSHNYQNLIDIEIES